MLNLRQTIKHQMPIYIPKFIRRVVSFIFSSAHLIGYNHILLETHPKKLIRLYQDNSYFLRQMEHEGQPTPARNLLNFITAVLYRDKKCINPCIRKLLVWYAVVFVSFMYFFIQAGIMMAFGQPVWLQFLNSPALFTAHVICLIVLYLDIFVQIVTGYISQGVLVRQPEKVVANYLRYLFFFDLAIVLVESIALGVDSFAINYFKLVIILKFVRLFQIDRFILRRLSLHKLSKTAYVIGKQFITIFNVSIVVGIAFYLLDLHFLNSPLCQDNPSFCWLNSSVAYSPIIALDWSLQYFYIVYYGIDTVSTISYGDIQSHNPYQQIYEIYTMLFSFILYAYIINNIIKIILWARKQEDDHKAETLLIDVYMKDLHIKQELKQEILAYLKSLYVQQLNRDSQSEQELLSKLPQDLRFQFLQGVYHGLYQGLSNMLETNLQIRNLLLHVRESIYTSNQEIVAQDELMARLLFVERGQVRFDCKCNAIRYEISKVFSGSFVGQKSFFCQQKMPFSIIAQKSSTLYSLGYQEYYESCRVEQLKQKMKRLQYYVKTCQNYTKISQKCYYCSQGHIWNECPNKFPNFSNCQLASSKTMRLSREKAKQRGLWHNILICKNQLKILETFTKIHEDHFYNKMHKRIQTIKQKIGISRQMFQVDSAYDWQFYLPDANLSRLRLVWEEKKLQKNLARMSSFRLSRRKES